MTDCVKSIFPMSCWVVQLGQVEYLAVFMVNVRVRCGSSRTPQIAPVEPAQPEREPGPEQVALTQRRLGPRQ
jgi:hypothetical protein